MTTYALNEEKMFADITDGIAIIINSDTGVYYGMNPLGTAVFEKLIQGADSNDILSALKALANVPDDIAAKLEKFIAELSAKGLIIPATGNNKSICFNTDISTENNFEMTLNEYSDAQELLMADPIHEIKEETGWTPEKSSIGYTKEETKEREKKMQG